MVTNKDWNCGNASAVCAVRAVYRYYLGDGVEVVVEFTRPPTSKQVAVLRRHVDLHTEILADDSTVGTVAPQVVPT